jgi:hypothetical protein
MMKGLTALESRVGDLIAEMRQVTAALSAVRDKLSVVETHARNQNAGRPTEHGAFAAFMLDVAAHMVAIALAFVIAVASIKSPAEPWLRGLLTVSEQHHASPQAPPTPAPR